MEVSGTVNGEALTYTARANLGPDCDAVVEAEVMLNAAGTEVHGNSNPIHL